MIKNRKMSSVTLSLSKKLITIPSTEDSPQALRDALNLAKHELQGNPMEEFESNGVPSLLVRNTNERTKHFKLILNAHLDVVPGRKEQFHPFEKDGRLYGRGAYDMKAAAAVMIVLFKHLAKNIPYPLGLQLVTDEERVSDTGTGYQVKQGITCDFAIVGEAGTNFNIKNKAKGHMVIKLTTYGISAHGAYPWLGENAIIYMHEVIAVLMRLYPRPKEPVWANTVTVARIETQNEVHNKIPDQCSIYLDVRYIDDPNVIIETIRKNIHEKVVIEKLIDVTSHYIDQNNHYFQLLKQTAEKTIGREISIIEGHGGSDVRFFPNAGVEFGPIGAHHHADNEWVDIKSLEDYYQILKNFLLSI